jgi:hypothetical protein
MFRTEEGNIFYLQVRMLLIPVVIDGADQRAFLRHERSIRGYVVEYT